MPYVLLNPFTFYLNNGWMQMVSDYTTEDLWVIVKFVINSDQLYKFTSCLHAIIFVTCMNVVDMLLWLERWEP